MNANNVISIHLEQALAKLTNLGLAPALSDSASNAFLPLIQRVEHLDPERALVIARIMQQSVHFNEVVRTQLSSIEIGNRYVKIAALFDAVLEDCRTMVGWMKDDKLDWKEKMALKWMDVRHGTVIERFEEIRKTFDSVIVSTNEQIRVESAVLDAYLEFRFAIKEAESAAYDIADKASAALTLAKQQLLVANDKIASAQSASEKSSLELERDKQLHLERKADSDYQIIKDISEQLKTAYNSSELVFARIQQSVSMKNRIYEHSVSYFTINDIGFTALLAAFVSAMGLAEDTNALVAMQSGFNRSVDALAELGDQQLEASARIGYGSGGGAEHMERLANSVVAFQEKLIALVNEQRAEATQNADQIEAVNNAAKTRIVELIARG